MKKIFIKNLVTGVLEVLRQNMFDYFQQFKSNNSGMTKMKFIIKYSLPSIVISRKK